MSEKLIEELKRENLCTHFILPLLKLNKFSFVSFVDSYIATSTHEKDCLFVICKYIAIRIITPELLSRRILLMDEYYGMYEDQQGHIYVVYKVPGKWMPDLEQFIQGKYSEMSENAKKMIIRWSRLPYQRRDPVSGGVFTDGRICALYKESVLRDMWERKLDYVSPHGMVHIPSYVDKDQELLSIPDERSFIELDTLTKINQPEL